MSGVQKQILLGQCHRSLPPLRKRVVRIFTSSTFTDTSVERNALMRDVYPKLKDYSKSKHGLEFQVVDMRWGVRDEATDDHMTSELCMNEIAACQTFSIGPNFVTFLCQKYGYRPFPPKIPAVEFEAMRKVSMENGESVETLDEWFVKDQNAIPAIYILQPISSKLKHFNDEQNADKMNEDRNKWWGIFESVQAQLRNAASVCEKKGTFNKTQAAKYTISVTHDEVQHGVIDASGKKEDHCVCFVRKFTDLEQRVDNKEARNFIDIKWENNQVDQEAKQLLGTLRDKAIPNCLKPPNLIVSNLKKWSEKGVDVDIPEHRQYLDEFLKKFYDTMVMLIDRAVKEDTTNISNNPMYEEILQHLTFCKLKCQSFHGRDDLLAKVKGYLQERVKGSPATASPMVIYGESGSGKTSVTAKAAFQTTSEWFGNKSPAVILRFLGTTPASTGVRQLLKSVCQQVLSIYGGDPEQVPDDYFRVVRCFAQVLSHATREKPLVIFLDSLDQLSPAEGAHRMAWLPRNLPPHVAIVVSTLPNEFSILKRLRAMLPKAARYAEVNPLTVGESIKIVESWLLSEKRGVNADQKSVISNAIQQCSLPLFLRLLYDQARKWQSYLPVNQLQINSSVKGMISLIFDRLENYHGKTLVQRALGYLTISQNGISETELEDLLSLDDDVLQDVYAYWLPPTRRIPPLLWTRIRAEINDYLVEREADSSRVIYWYHRQFIETAKERYLKDIKYVTMLHMLIAEYYIGTWSGGQKKPFKYSQQQMKKFNKSEKDEEDRHVAPQPLQFGDGRFNIRKLTQLPYHLILAEDKQKLKEHTLCNFDFLMAKLKGMDLGEVLQDFTAATEKDSSDEEIRAVSDAIQMGASAIRDSADNLVFELIGRLKYADGKFITRLVSEAETATGIQVPLLPYNRCLPEGGGLLRTQLVGHSDKVECIATTTDGRLLVSGSKDKTAIIWDLQSGTSLHTLEGRHDAPVFGLVISPDNLLVITYSFMTTNERDEDDRNAQINVWNIETGEHFVQLDGHTGLGNCAMRITPDSKFAVAEMFTEWKDDCTYVRNYFFAVWNLENGQPLYKRVETHKDRVYDLVIAKSAEGGHVVVTSGGAKDPTIKTWDLKSGKMIVELLDYSKRSHRESRKLGASEGGRYVAFHWEKDGILDVHTNEFQYVNHGTHGFPKEMRFFDGDSKLMVLCGGMIIYDVATRNVLTTMSFDGGGGMDPTHAYIVRTEDMELVVLLHERCVHGFVVSPPKKGARNNYCETLARLHHVKPVKDMCVVSHQSSHLAVTASSDQTIKVWNVGNIREKDKALDEYNEDTNETFYSKKPELYRVVNRLKLVQEEERVAVLDNLGDKLSLYDVDSGTLLSKKKWEDTRSHTKHPMSSIDTNPGGTRLFGIGAKSLIEYNTKTLEEISNRELDVWCSGLRISNDGNATILIEGDTYADDIHGFDIEKMWYRGQHDPDDRANNIHFLRDGTILLVTCVGMFILEMKNLEVISKAKTEHGDYIICSTMNRDENVLIACCYDGTVKLYEVPSGKELSRFQAHQPAPGSRLDEHAVTDVTLSFGGSYFVTSSSDKTIKLWDMATLRLVFVFTGHTNTVTMAKITADDKFIVSTASEEFTFRVWSAVLGIQVININAYSPIEAITIIPKKNRVFITTSDDRAMFFKVKEVDEDKLREQFREQISKLTDPIQPGSVEKPKPKNPRHNQGKKKEKRKNKRKQEEEQRPVQTQQQKQKEIVPRNRTPEMDSDDDDMMATSLPQGQKSMTCSLL